MRNRQRWQNNPLEDPDKLLQGMQLCNPAEGFSDRVMERLSLSDRSLVTASQHVYGEWKNGLIAAAATILFVASDIPSRLVSVNPGEVGLYIQVNVLSAVQFGIHLIRFN